MRSFDTSAKTLAEWHHRNEFGSPARKASAAGFFVSIEIGRPRRVAATHSSNLVRRRPYHCWPRTRERAGPRRWASARAAAVSGANLVVSYFATRGFENFERIIKR
ncbi:hypothetical protein IVA94_11700 [Bradyrhizobium sp. 156]|uniref:hypothetical protein n=1 Tax=Bradyrhizobium sp. 156 TaxID=2782630 RepID=UPI001FF97801|nr:hypothetical protein [Bradyrhizobium sp. 156]MCK1321549.1 hypothetical protein [Bradyrhizobium sp. 156]